MHHIISPSFAVGILVVIAVAAIVWTFWFFTHPQSQDYKPEDSYDKKKS